MQIAIIGAGNIGKAITEGLIQSDAIAASDLFVSDINQTCLDQIKLISSEIKTSTRNLEAMTASDIIILAVKPWLMDVILDEVQAVYDKKKHVILSVAAGIDFETISKSLGNEATLFRIMPNTAISISESMTLIASKNATKEQEDFVLGLFAHLGKAFLIPEKQMAAATSIASCGIAYALRYLRAATQGAIELGFNADLAQEVVAQTMKGAAELILQNDTHTEIEIDKVTTPGGWTIKGLNEMEANGFTNAVIKGLKANGK
jgi:pyrroline-5-carboxylate reductase